MKNLTKLIALVLCLVLLAGCGGGAKKTGGGTAKVYTAEMDQDETDVAEFLKNIYNGFTAEAVEQCVLDGDAFVADAIKSGLTDLSEATLKDLIAKYVTEVSDTLVYTVSAVYESGAGVNDTVLVKQDGENKIILQQLLDTEAQDYLIEEADSFNSVLPKYFDVCNKALDITDALSTPLCITEKNVFFPDELGNALPGKSGAPLTKEAFNNKVGNDGSGHGNSTTQTGGGIPQTRSDGRKLVWHNEFDSTADIYSTFTHKYDNMFSNSDFLAMSQSENNIFINNGNLVLRVTDDGDGTYTTARSICSRDFMSFRYGYLEMRAKVPFQKCVWPSFWMQTDPLYKESPYSGEIDIFEVFGSTNTAVANLHKWVNGKSDPTGSTKGKFTGNCNYKFKDTANLSDTYHIYGFEWNEDEMKFYVDDYCYYTISIREADDYSTKNPGMQVFRDYYYLCFNNWLFTSENSWTGQDVAKTPLTNCPIDYTIDYLRLYQFENSKEDIKLAN